MGFSDEKFQVATELLSEQVEKRGTLCFNVVTNCMAPLIRSKDKIVVKKFIPEKLISGDIILFNIGNTLCTHRYILRQERNGKLEYITKGDRLFKFDLPITENKIVGKIIAIMHKNNYINLNRKVYKMRRLFLGNIFKIQWFTFKLFRNFFLIFSKHNNIDKYFIRNKKK